MVGGDIIGDSIMHTSLFRTALLALLSSAACLAQMATGNIGGQVQDASGAVLPNAKVTLVHSATGLTRVVKTNERGEFLAPLLPIGEYEVSAEFQGFKRSSISGVRLLVDQTVMLPIRMDPGAVSETVEVHSVAPLLNAENSSLGQVIENNKVVDMPLNGRNVFALGLLAGNTVEVFGVGTNQTFAAGGGRFSGNEILLDGISNNTTSWAGSIGRNSVLYTPSVDAMEEFKVKTSNFSAEFGHSAGAVVSATIKSGTNQFHGAVFEFLRNNDLDATNFFTNAAGQAKSPYHQNQFGFALGGPLDVPKVYSGHDRTFFFIDYQGTRRATTAGSTIYDLPSMAFRAGDFSALKAGIYDPASRQIGPSGSVIANPFPNNLIPANRLNATSVAIEQQIPAPNFGAPGASARDYFRSPSQPFTGDQFDARLDQKISASNSLFARFSFSNTFQPNPGIFPGALGGGSSQLEYARHGVVSDTHIFSPTRSSTSSGSDSRDRTEARSATGARARRSGRPMGLACSPLPCRAFRP